MVRTKTKPMKIFLYCLLALSFFMSASLPGQKLFAAEAEASLQKGFLPVVNNSEADIANTPGGAPALLDPQNLLSPEQQNRLSYKASELSQVYGIDVVLVVMDLDTGQNSRQNAEDIFDYGGYGQHGLLGLIDIQNLAVWISTTRKGMDLISDGQASNIAQKVIERCDFLNNEYGDAMNTMAKEFEKELSKSLVTETTAVEAPSTETPATEATSSETPVTEAPTPTPAPEPALGRELSANEESAAVALVVIILLIGGIFLW